MFAKSEAFSGFAVKDLAAAKQFYGQALGLEVTDEPMGIVGLHLPTGATVMVYPKPDHEPATYTILNFPVDDIDQAVDGLAAKGVSCLQYDGFEQDAKGISRDPRGPAIAWFTDPSGNVLSVLQEQ